jgi:hypothetical protein
MARTRSHTGFDVKEPSVTDKPNPVQIQKFLSGVDYPVGRGELVAHAESRGADESVLQYLRALPDREHAGPNAVSQAYSRAT